MPNQGLEDASVNQRRVALPPSASNVNELFVAPFALTKFLAVNLELLSAFVGAFAP